MGDQMNKKILQDYVDACELIKETEREIDKLRSKRELQDSVKGSMSDFPYVPVNIHISGIEHGIKDGAVLREQEKLLQERQAFMREIKRQVDRWMAGIPARMQRIVKYRYFERMPWEQVAIKMGGKVTGDSIKMEFRRFLQKNQSLF